jgi:hypothetical protein
MKSATLINFQADPERKVKYTAACKELGTSVSKVCRAALDEAVRLADRMKERREAELQTQKTSAPSPAPESRDPDSVHKE